MKFIFILVIFFSNIIFASDDEITVNVPTKSSVSFRGFRFSDEATGFDTSYSYGFKSGGSLGVGIGSEANQLDEKYRTNSLQLFGSKDLSHDFSFNGYIGRTSVSDHFTKQSSRITLDYFLNEIVLTGGVLLQRWDFESTLANVSNQKLSSVGWSARIAFEQLWPFTLELSRDQYLYQETQLQEFNSFALSDISNSEVYRITQWIQSIRISYQGHILGGYINVDESDQVADNEKFKSVTFGLQYYWNKQWSLEIDASDQDYKSLGLSYFWY
jgi:hypothetical protein